jgi:hypothetical protein
MTFGEAVETPHVITKTFWRRRTRGVSLPEGGPFPVSGRPEGTFFVVQGGDALGGTYASKRRPAVFATERFSL